MHWSRPVRTVRLVPPLALTAFACVAFAGGLPKIPKGGSLPVSFAAGGTVPNSDSFEGCISNNGRYVAFYTDADNVITPDANNRYDIFLRDRKKDTVELVSRTPTGEPGNEQSYYPAISANGRYLLYVTQATDIVPFPNTDHGRLQLVFFDRKKGTSRLVTRGPTGDAGNELTDVYDDRPMSANGRLAVFTSRSDNLIDNDGNAFEDVFIADLRKGTLRRLVEGLDGPPNGPSFNASISPNGRFVVFASSASNLVAGDDNDESDIFLYDVKKRRLRLVSVSTSGAQTNAGVLAESASVDNRGRLVTFTSAADNLSEEPDTNGRRDVFLRDVRRGTTTRISMGAQGGEADGDSGDSAITPNGRLVVFWSRASNLVDPTDDLRFDHVVYDVRTGVTRRLLPAADGGAPDSGVYGYWNGLSANGKWVVTASDANNVSDVDARDTWDVFLVRLR